MNTDSRNMDAWVPNFSFAQGNIAGFQSAIARQAESYLKTSAKILDQMEGLSQVWLRYRREHLNNSLQAVREVMGSQDLGQTVAIYNEWLSTSIKKLSEEASALPDQIRQIGESGQHAGEEGMQALQENLQQAERQFHSAGNGHDQGHEMQGRQEHRVAQPQEREPGHEHRVA